MLLPTWLAVAFLGLGAVSFAERNWLVTKKELARAIVCVDADAGRVRWTREGLRGPQPVLNRRNSPATPTAASDGERVFAWFGSAGLMCTDLEGKLLWTVSDVPFEDVHGVGASPILCGGLLIVPGTQPYAPYIAALDPKTGKRAWTATLRPWPGGEGQARTPSLLPGHSGSFLLVWAWDGEAKEDLLRAFDPISGEERWHQCVPTNGEQVASVVSDRGMVFLPTSRRVYALDTSLSTNPIVWQTELKCRGQLVASPVLCNGLLFIVSAHRDAHCLDAATGELLWSRQLPGRGCFASPVAVGGRVYFCDVSGKTTVVAAERSFRKLAENDLGEPLFASPAPAAGRLYIRTKGHLWCIEGD